LWVFQENLPARAFYERHGLHVIEETDGSRNEERDARCPLRVDASGPVVKGPGSGTMACMGA
jgi:hypothetical protein